MKSQRFLFYVIAEIIYTACEAQIMYKQFVYRYNSAKENLCF
jgi:hypothetical protein